MGTTDSYTLAWVACSYHKIIYPENNGDRLYEVAAFFLVGGDLILLLYYVVEGHRFVNKSQGGIETFIKKTEHVLTLASNMIYCQLCSFMFIGYW